MKKNKENKNTLIVAVVSISSLAFWALIVVLLYGGVINHPGHCGATNPHTLDYESLFSDGGSIVEDAGKVGNK